MLKSFRIDKTIRETINRVSQNTLGRIKEKYGNIDGREEDITSKLEDKLGENLVDEIQNELNGQIINGLAFDIFTYKKTQEKHNGADIFGVVDIQVNGKRVRKSYLAQCKIGHIVGYDSFSVPIFNCRSSKDILQQAENMLAISSDSFFFIYTDIGIFTLPAFQLRLCNKTNYINSNEIYFHGLGSFYAEFFKCFIGDEKLMNNFNATIDIKKLVEQKNIFDELKINNLTYTTIKETEQKIE